MKLNIHSNVYEPRVKFEKIYNQTLYGTGQTDAFYSAVISTNDPAGDGFASIDETFDRIAARVTAGTDDFNNAAPASAKQILNIDFSGLEGIYQRAAAEGQTQKTLADYMGDCGANCLVFVPQGAGATTNNVAEKIGKETYRATYNVVLTDKQPFYTPYDIQVPSANTLTYQRLITKDDYGKVQNASLILPFAVALDGSGKHTNPDGTSFSLHTMQASKALELKDDQMVAYFPPLNNVSEAAANTPYLVKIDGNSSADGVIFTISQPGAPISKTTDMASDYTFAGAASSGVTAGGSGDAAGTYTFTPKGTFAGQQVPKAQNIFYFAKNVFVSSLDYAYDAPINIAPFRAYYNTTQANGAKLSFFTPVFEEGEGDVITAIAPVAAVLDVDAPVYDLQGRMVAPTYRKLKGKKLAAGMYVVNGVKIIVK